MFRLLSIGILAAALAALPAQAQERAADSTQSGSPPAAGPTPSPEDRAKLEAEIAKELGTKPGASGQPATTGSAASTEATAATTPPSAATGGSPLARVLLLPDISAIGSGALSWSNFVDDSRSRRAGPWSDPDKVTPLFEELELGLQAVVDPYARADVFLSFGPDGAAVEEAYLTALTLPGGLVARAGKLFAPFGRINTQHPHTWEFVDRPLALQRLLAPEALGGAGVAAAWLAPVSWFSEFHLAYQGVDPVLPVVTNGSTTIFARAGTARWINFVDLSERLSLGAGVSGTLMESTNGWRDVTGADLFLKYRPGATRAYLAFQAEALWRRMRETPGGGSDWGTYAQAVYHPEAHWGFGARWDRAPGFAGDAVGGVEQRWSGLASWAPSEFQRYRLQAGWTRLPDGADGYEALLGIEFAIGAHGAHPF